MKKVMIGMAAGILLSLLAGLGYGLSGAFNVAATERDAPVLKWFLHQTFEASVARRSAALTVSADLTEIDRVRSGARSFAAMCAGCHTPPGMTESPRTQGLNPKPPALAELAGHASAAQTFWVIKHGVRMSGMPAFGPTHDDTALWDLTAFVGQAQELTAAQYQQWSKGPADDGHDHRHADEDQGSDGSHRHSSGAADASAKPTGVHGSQTADLELPGRDASPEAVVEYFHAALGSGDESRVVAVLLPDVRIFESGGVEASLAAYRSHHLKSDLKAAQSIRHQVVSRQARIEGQSAWVMTQTQIVGDYGGKQINRPGTETMNLVQTPAGWRIAHIHWSSGKDQPKAPSGHEGHDHEH